MLGPGDTLDPVPRRVLVAGTTGVGKTTTAARIGAVLGLPHTEIDAPLPRSGMGAAGVLRGRRRGVHERAGVGHRVAVHRGAGAPGSACGHPRVDRPAEPRRTLEAGAQDTPAPPAPHRDVERQRRALAVDVLHRTPGTSCGGGSAPGNTTRERMPAILRERRTCASCTSGPSARSIGSCCTSSGAADRIVAVRLRSSVVRAGGFYPPCRGVRFLPGAPTTKAAVLSDGGLRVRRCWSAGHSSSSAARRRSSLALIGCV